MDKIDVNENVLKNCYKNAKMALLSLDEVIPKSSGALKEELLFQHEGYNKHIAEIALIAKKLGIDIPEVSGISKSMLNATIGLKTLADGSNSHIAEMTLKGTVTGYTTLMKDVSEFSPFLYEEVLQAVTQLQAFEEACEQNLKKYL
ncbi:MAG: hypothetical protein IJA15_02555 [Clostridia bacterium]|nr:hypothetical protein [Clostridia bacterium]